jgi:putative ABC transport system permease protein
MLAHYLAVALAKFRKTPFTTAANVLTLALGLACFIAAYGIATYWRSADGYHQGAERLFVVGQNIGAPGEAPPDFVATTSTPTLARYLALDIPQVESVARVMALSDSNETPVTAGDQQTFLNVGNVDPELLRMFDFDFVAGDARHALDDPQGVVLTQAAAERLFGDAPALGRSLLLFGGAERIVTGVIAPVRQPSFMGDGADAVSRFDMLGNWSSSFLGSMWDSNEGWGMYAAYTFVRLSPGASIDDLNAQLPALLERRVPPEQFRDMAMILEAFPVSELTTRGLDNLLLQSSGLGLSTISVLLGLGLLTLSIAGLNYANLATAQAATRGKEVGMRKVLGAGRVQVLLQAWLEALLLTALALGLALAVLALAAPAARALTGVDILYFLSSGARPAAVLGGIVVATALAAGAYPAIAQSRVRPVEALTSGRSRSGSPLLARLLVGVQFASASFLLILVVVTQLQRGELERVVLAAREDPIVLLGAIGMRIIGVDHETFRARLLEHPEIKSVSFTNHGPWGVGGISGLSLARSSEAGAASSDAYFKYIDYDYFPTLNLDVLAGRVFDRERDAGSVAIFAAPEAQTPSVVIDRSLAERLGYPTPQAAVDQVVYIPGDWVGAAAARAVRVVGVTETETTQLGSGLSMRGTVYAFASPPPNGGQYPLIRVDRERVAEGVAAIRQVWRELAPQNPPYVRFFDEMFEASYRRYARVGQLFTVLAAAAFVIASVGLLGMAAHATGRRRHEIGVRKVLGSTTLGIVRLLLMDFAKPILIANLLAWPLAWVAAEAYLSAFAHRAALTPAPFALSLAITLAVAWAAVIGEVLKAARIRPAEVLRLA